MPNHIVQPVRDQQKTIAAVFHQDDILRVVEDCIETDAIGKAAQSAAAAAAGHRADRARGRVCVDSVECDLPNQVIVAIGDKDQIAAGREAARTAECRGLIRADDYVLGAGGARAGECGDRGKGVHGCQRRQEEKERCEGEYKRDPSHVGKCEFNA